jgi:flavin reductase (DIM6/NTAB) family NADH-FMN oxidoreductase RutF
MSFHAFNMGCNIIAFAKDNTKYGMCVSWAQMLDYDVISLLIGESSVTGKNIQIGDIVGVSALSKPQRDIALRFGEHHSDTFDKFDQNDFFVENTAILIKDAKVTMKCKVIDVKHLDFSYQDYFVILRVLSSSTIPREEFLSLEEL